MDPVAQVALAVVSVLVLLSALVSGALAWSARAGQRRADRALHQSQGEVAALAARVDGLSAELARAHHDLEAHEPEFVITSLTAREPDPALARPGAQPSPATAWQRQLVSVIRRSTLDRPAEGLLVAVAFRTVAVGHGVRRALSPDNRDRIAFEVRRATRRSRRARRQELRTARRQARARRLAAGRAPAAGEDAA